MADASNQTMALLHRLADGDEAAGEELFALVHEELHGVAHRMMAKERKGHTLQTTALMNEAWMRLAGGSGGRFQDREHFVRVAARAMRRVLVDHARKRTAKKRQYQRAEPIVEDALAYWDDKHDDLLALDEALDRLGAEDETLQRLVELRFFGGLTLEETGAVLGWSVQKTFRSWSFARTWLRRELARGGGDV